MIREYLRNKPRLFDFIKAVSRRCGNRTAMYEFLHQVLPRDREVTFLQAGANDGLTNDPYREFILQPNFRGVLVEPAPYPFRQLKAGYRHKGGLRFEDCLISYPPGQTVAFYTFAEAFLGKRADASHLSMLSSLSIEQLSAAVSSLDDCRENIVRTEVVGRTIEDLMARHSFKSFDCLFIDIEGYEPKVLMAMDYAEVRPKLIAFESLHLGPAQAEIRAHLEQRGFRLFSFDQEMIALGAEWAGAAKGLPAPTPAVELATTAPH